MQLSLILAPVIKHPYRALYAGALNAVCCPMFIHRCDILFYKISAKKTSARKTLLSRWGAQRLLFRVSIEAIQMPR
jgi:hypothetical protein